MKDEIAPAALCYYRVSREISLIAPSLGNKDPMQCTLETWILEPIQYLNSFLHRRQKCEHCSPNSLRPISYFGSIWELYVLDLKTKVFCRKENQLLTLSHEKGTQSVKIVLIVWPEIPQMSQNRPWFFKTLRSEIKVQIKRPKR